MCWLVGHLESWSVFCCRRHLSQEGHFGTREVSIGCVREARNGLGSAALTIFLQINLVEWHNRNSCLSAAEMYSS
jgi:hypothetical protein